MKTLIKFILGISTVLFFIFCLSSGPVQKQITDIFQQNTLSDEEFNVEEFFEGTSEVSETNEEVEGTQDTEVKVQKYHSPEVIKYFNEITLGSEFGEGRKNPYRWTTDVKIFVQGRKHGYLMEELNDVVSDLNSIIKTINIEVVSNPKDANLFLFLGSRSQFLSAHPDISNLPDCLGFFCTYYNEAKTFVDLDGTSGRTEFQRHILREEITQSLGLFNDSETYDNSIFYDGYNGVTEYSQIDREIIDMLYNE